MLGGAAERFERTDGIMNEEERQSMAFIVHLWRTMDVLPSDDLARQDLDKIFREWCSMMKLDPKTAEQIFSLLDRTGWLRSRVKAR